MIKHNKARHINHQQQPVLAKARVIRRAIAHPYQRV
jgi:hypothetical protein